MGTLTKPTMAESSMNSAATSSTTQSTPIPMPRLAPAEMMRMKQKMKISSSSVWNVAPAPLTDALKSKPNVAIANTYSFSTPRSDSWPSVRTGFWITGSGC